MTRNTILHIERNTPTVNEPAGEAVDAWERIAKEWFGYQSMSASESQVPGNMQATASHRLESVFIANMRPGLRLTAGEDVNNPTRKYEVLSVTDRNNEHRVLDWMVAEVV